MLAVLTGVSACGDDEPEDEPASAAPTAPAPQAGGEGAPAGEAPTETDDGPQVPDENMVGGVEVDIASFPWVVALRSPGTTDNFCGGALVGTGAVMTAAHCVTQRGATTIVPPASIEVVLGRTDLSDQSSGQVVGVSKVWVVRDYQPAGLAYDFAVLQLAQDVTNTPIALPTPGQTDYWRVGQNTLTLGWGCESGNPPGELCSERTALSPLKAALLKVQEASVCTEAYGGASPTALCMRSTDQSAGICQGDSGGPWAVYDDAGKPYLVGITSFNHKDGECSPAIPQGAAFVAYVTTDQRWFRDGIWNECAGAAPCPTT